MDRLKKNRALSFLVISIVYVLAIGVGAAIYSICPFESWLSLLIADVAATIFVFIFSVIFQNASVYDPYWSVQPIVILTAFAFRYGITPVTIFPLIAVWIWGIRLTANWAYTFRGLCAQDWRYTMLHEKTGKWYPFVNFCGIHMVPTLIVYSCCVQVTFLFSNNPEMNPFGLVFFILSIGAAVLQGIADYEMHVFRKQKTGKFIRIGLWKYSRHPNYLGEILMWWGIGIYCVINLGGYIWLLAGALLNTLMFFFISIPLGDGRQAKKPGFEEYRKETFALLPIPKKKRD